MTRLVDLDDIAGLERAWSEVERLRAVRTLDPELRADIMRHVDRLDPDVAAPILDALDRLPPAVVLEAYFETIVPNRPTIGAFPRLSTADAPDPGRWIREDPQRLAAVIQEMARFTDDRRAIAQAALDLADGVGIEEELADRIVSEALRDLNGGRSDAR
jgi:hypothetical protein